jgi:hypothetical protein
MYAISISALFFVMKEIKNAVSSRTNEMMHDWLFERLLKTTKVSVTCFRKLLC